MHIVDLLYYTCLTARTITVKQVNVDVDRLRTQPFGCCPIRCRSIVAFSCYNNLICCLVSYIQKLESKKGNKNCVCAVWRLLNSQMPWLMMDEAFIQLVHTFLLCACINIHIMLYYAVLRHIMSHYVLLGDIFIWDILRHGLIHCYWYKQINAACLSSLSQYLNNQVLAS